MTIEGVLLPESVTVKNKDELETKAKKAFRRQKDGLIEFSPGITPLFEDGLFPDGSTTSRQHFITVSANRNIGTYSRIEVPDPVKNPDSNYAPPHVKDIDNEHPLIPIFTKNTQEGTYSLKAALRYRKGI